jgi:hypothetical protein
MDQDQPDSETVEQGQVMNKTGKTGLRHHLTTKGHHEHPIAERIDIWSRISEILYKCLIF